MKYFIALIFIFTSDVLYASCTVEEVTKIVKDGGGRKAIEESCENEIDDAPRCSYKRVVQLAMAKKRASAIEDECGLCDRPQCELANGAVCSLGYSAPQGVKPGDSCYCATPLGPINGELTCNN
ncbi:MAG: hypothetical protein U1F46_04625 [Marinagarivorans sp.]